MPKDQGTDREGGKNMVIHAVTEPLFKAYGRVVEGYQLDGILQALAGTPVPADTTYVALEPALQNASGAKEAGEAFFGGMPFQMGYCNGHNTKLNCLEYHRDSEFNLGTEDFILLLARIDDIEDGKLDTGKVGAFRVPAGVLVEVYATTLHYAPCHVHSDKGFQVLVALPLFALIMALGLYDALEFSTKMKPDAAGKIILAVATVLSVGLMIYHGESNAVEKGKNGNLSSYAKKILKRL